MAPAKSLGPRGRSAGATLVDAASLVGNSSSVDEVFAPVAVSGDVSSVIERRPRRSAHHPHPVQGDFYRVQGSTLPTRPGMTADVVDHGTPVHREALERNLALLPPEARQSEDEIYDALVEAGVPRMSAAEQAHREIAAAALSVGATSGEAADYAGVTEATVARFLKDESFNQLVADLRGHVVGRIAGRIVQRLDTLTDREHIEELDIDDLLHIHDRVAGPKSAAGAARGTTVNVAVAVQYEQFLAEIASADARAEGSDFPTYGAGLVPVPGGGSFRTGEVPRPVRRPEGGED